VSLHYRRPMSTWVEPEVWYAQLPSFHAAATGLITATGTDHVLLVKPVYRDDWSLPGGYVEAGEFPHDACARELHEELGLTVKPDTLLVVDWAPPEGKRPRAIISLTFDCGEIPTDADLSLAADELADWAFLPPQEAAGRLPANVAPRISAALRARASGETAYLAGGRLI
jgi:8-oxo-dGTP diphosphatase